MICPRCQQTIREGALFCDNCGYSLGSHSAAGELALALADTLKPDPLIGYTLDGRYRLIEELGKGGMGVVYRAERVLVGDEVAVKILRREFVAEPEAVARFRREARAAARLRHPNVVVIHDYGEARGGDAPAFIVMELLKGESLRDLLQREKRLEPEHVIALMRGICAGIGTAHRNAIVHRDIKPDNIIVLPPDEEEGRAHETVKVVDFGIAKLRDPASGGTLTQKGFQLGTVYYMSPEQCLGDDLDARSDVYSLGALCYEMLAGVPPFTGETRNGIITKHLHTPPPSFPAEVRVPAALSTVVMRALSKDPAERQADAAALSRELQAAEREEQEAQQLRAAEERQRAAAEEQRLAEEARRREEELAQQRFAEQQRREAEAREKREAEEAARRLAAEEQRRREEERQRLEVEERRREEERQRAGAEEARREREAEEQRQREAAAARLEQEAGQRREAEAAKIKREAEAAAELQRRAEAAERQHQAELAEAEKRSAQLRATLPAGVPSPPHPPKPHPEAGAPVLWRCYYWLKGLNPGVLVGAFAVLSVVVLGMSLFLMLRQPTGAPPANENQTANANQTVLDQPSSPAGQPSSPAGNPIPPPGMAFVPGGEFMMGRSRSDGGDDYENPAHLVRVKPFFIDLAEVTCEEYKKFLDAAPQEPAPSGWKNRNYPAGAARKPVVGVAWDEATAYAKWAGKRLPTEEEWEFAARGHEGRRYPWGNQWEQAKAFANQPKPQDESDAAVQSLMAESERFSSGSSPFGALNMAGNAWEWTATDLKAYPGGTLPKQEYNNLKVIRGGSVIEDPDQATTTYRRGYPPRGQFAYTYIGFRCAQDVADSSAAK